MQLSQCSEIAVPCRSVLVLGRWWTNREFDGTVITLLWPAREKSIILGRCAGRWARVTIAKLHGNYCLIIVIKAPQKKTSARSRSEKEFTFVSLFASHTGSAAFALDTDTFGAVKAVKAVIMLVRIWITNRNLSWLDLILPDCLARMMISTSARTWTHAARDRDRDVFIPDLISFT